MTDWRPGADLETLHRRGQTLALIRRFFAERGVLEVQVPVIGARSVSDPDVESVEVAGHGYLQTSPEYFMKRLLAAGAPSIYSMAPAFRADEAGRHHSAEFTMLEWYRRDFDDEALMREVAELVDAVLGVGSYRSVTYAELVGDFDGARAQLDLRFANACAALDGRVFVTDYPKDQAALARIKPSIGTAARFELVIDGREVANGYWELTDVDEHRRRFAADNAIRRERGLRQRDLDEAFLAALDHGLPPCAGVALGFDRLLMLALGKRHIKEVQSF